MKRIFAVGDIHGCDIALETLLEQLALAPDDRLILLGDAIDRGPDSRRVVEMLLETGNLCRLDFVMGNHEQMLLDALENPAVADSWLGWGGAETLDSYGGRFADIPGVRSNGGGRGRLVVWRSGELSLPVGMRAHRHQPPCFSLQSGPAYRQPRPVLEIRACPQASIAAP